MTAILDRIQTVRNKLDSFENIDQAQDYISTLSSDDYFALKIFLKSWKNLKSFIAERNDVDDDLMIWLEILGIYLTVPDEDRKRESKQYKKKITEEYEYDLETYRRVKKDPSLQRVFNVDIELLQELLTKQKMLKKMKKRRVRDSTEITRYLKMIVKILREKGWSNTKQRNFIYDLYYCFNYENCRNIDQESYKNKIWVMIHRL